MTSIQLLDLLTKRAKEYRKGANEAIKRNSHMNSLSGNIEIPQEAVDALLVDFINYIGVNMCVDYALYTKDLEEVPLQATHSVCADPLFLIKGCDMPKGSCPACSN